MNRLASLMFIMVLYALHIAAVSVTGWYLFGLHSVFFILGASCSAFFAGTLVRPIVAEAKK